jgi:hypothetical protein
MSRTLGGRSAPDGIADIEVGRYPVRIVDVMAHPAVLIKARRFISGVSGSAKSAKDCINPVCVINDYSGRRSFFLLRRLCLGYTCRLNLTCETIVYQCAQNQIERRRFDDDSKS